MEVLEVDRSPSLTAKGSLKHSIEVFAHLFQGGGDWCVF